MRNLLYKRIPPLFCFLPALFFISTNLIFGIIKRGFGCFNPYKNVTMAWILCITVGKSQQLKNYPIPEPFRTGACWDVSILIRVETGKASHSNPYPRATCMKILANNKTAFLLLFINKSKITVWKKKLIPFSVTYTIYSEVWIFTILNGDCYQLIEIWLL